MIAAHSQCRAVLTSTTEESSPADTVDVRLYGCGEVEVNNISHVLEINPSRDTVLFVFPAEERIKKKNMSNPPEDTFRKTLHHISLAEESPADWLISWKCFSHEIEDWFQNVDLLVIQIIGHLIYQGLD